MTLRRLAVGSLWAMLAIVLASPAQAQEQPQIRLDSIVVEGNVVLPDSVIIAQSGLSEGDFATLRDIQTAIKQLMATKRYRGVDILSRGRETGAVIVIRVEEEDIVQFVSVQGLETLDPVEVRDSLGLSIGDPYSPQQVADAIRFIREKLVEKGIPFATIEVERVPISGEERQIDVVLRVTEGERITVAEFVVIGNEAVTDEEIAGAIETRPEGFLWTRIGAYDPEVFRADVIERLPQFYASRGFLDLRLLRDTTIVDEQTGKARIEIELDEGPQYFVDGFEVEIVDRGTSSYSEDFLATYYDPASRGLLDRVGILGGGPGEGELPVFDQTEFMASLQEVQQLYAAEGYLDARVVPRISKHAPVEEGGQSTVSLGWEIQPGAPAYVNTIRIVGNEYTYDRVARDAIFLVPGGVFRQDLLVRSYQALSGLGFFETPLPFPDVQRTPTGDVDVTFRVQERVTGALSFGTTVGGGAGLAGFIGYDQPNLFGQAKQGHLRWDFGQYQNNFTLRFTDPRLFQSRISGSVSIFDQRDRFFTFDSGERKVAGAELRFGFPVPWDRLSRVFAGYRLSRTRYDQREQVEDQSIFSRPPGTQSALTVGFLRSTYNHQLFPTQGMRVSLNSDFSGGPLGGDGDFTKHVIEAGWRVPVFRPSAASGQSSGTRFGLGLSVKTGLITGDPSAFPLERFFLGGVQFGENLRGYDETSITPRGFFPDGSSAVNDGDRLGDAFFKVSADFLMVFSDNIGLSLFYDAGNIWAEPSQINPSRLFRGAGAGIQVVTPFGPVGFDYAYGFDKTNPSFQFHFRMGPGL